MNMWIAESAAPRAGSRLRSEGVRIFDQGSMLPHDEVERTMRRFADQVMPKLASA